MSSEWKLSMVAEPIVPAWTTKNECHVNGAELQRAILRGFSERKEDPVWSNKDEPFVFEKTFTFKEHGEFFRGALTMAGLRYAGDFFELLKRYGTIKVTITKFFECRDCAEAATHANSDATTPGFFSPKCAKHREQDLREGSAVVNAEAS